MGDCESTDDEAPVEISNRAAKKQCKKNVIHLSDSLKEVYEEGLQKLKDTQRARPRDPRFDPQVNGYCNTEDWSFVKTERQKAIKKLSKSLNYPKLSDEGRFKTKRALKLLKQKEATAEDFDIRRKVKNELKAEQEKSIEDGKIPKFLKRGELRQKIQQERLKKKTKHERAAYEAKQIKKKSRKHTNFD